MIVADYRINKHFEAIVANALPNAKGVNERLTKEARAIVATAQSILDTAPKTEPRDATNINDVKTQLTILPAETFLRGRKAPNRKPTVNNTKIPVVLVVSNAWQSKWYEYGKGRGTHFPALFFMRKAARAANNRYSSFKPRGKAKRVTR